MKCGHDDCFTCPYPDCVSTALPKAVKKTPVDVKHRQRLEYYKTYYQVHKEQILADRKKKYIERKSQK